MPTRLSRFWLVPVLALVCLCAQPVAVQAQCVTTGGVMVSTPGANTMIAYYNLTAPGMCMSVAANNAACFPASTNQTTTFLSASAMTPVTNPSCSWTCNCGTGTQNFSIDSSDGLPVELMDFEVEDDESSESAEDEDADSSAD